MERLYCKLLAWSIMRLVNRQKTYQQRCDRLNKIVNWLVDVYSDYSKGGHKICYNYNMRGHSYYECQKDN